MSISIRQRLTLWYTAAVAVLLGTIALSLFVVHARLSLLRLDAELQRLNATVAAVLQNELDEGLSPRAAAEDCLGEVRAAGRHVAILAHDGTVLAQRWTLPSGPAAAGGRELDGTWTVESATSFRVVSAARPPVPAGFIVVTAASWQELDADRRDIVRALMIVIPSALLIAAGGGWWVAGRALKPAAAMAAQAHRITEHSSGARLTIVRNDELGQLAAAFNGLVDRLDAALGARRRFLADASHELRTPVSIARTAADVALSRCGRSEAEYRDSLTIVSEQMKRLGRMVSDMLALARSDTADWPLAPSDFYLDELLAEVVRAMRLLSSEREVGIEATCPPDLQFRGDEGLVRQMLLNLLENAVRHTPPGGTVRVSAVPVGQDIGLSVQDTGRGIVEADRDRIFDRFVRIDPLTDGTGMGLGLAIARRIARAHHGELTLVATGPAGTTFEVTLPLHPH